jgi:dolichol-phosphate mannosyltransferase
MNYSNLTVILPTLNEAGNIKPLVESLQNVLPGSFVLVVDDNSSDGTPDVVKEVSLKYSRVDLIERKVNPCLTESIMAGVRKAETEYVAWMDADFSHPPEVLKKLYEIAISHGCCIATRFFNPVLNSSKNNDTQKNDSFTSSILSTILNFGVHYVLKLDITDYTSGFIVCRKSLISNYNFIGDYGEYFIALMYFLNRCGVNVKELYFESPPRTWGESKTGTNIFKLVRRGVKYIWMIIRLLLQSQSFRRASLKIKYPKSKL